MLVQLGNQYRRGEVFINRRFLRSENGEHYKPLKDDVALEKGTRYTLCEGAEFLSEMMLYSILLGLPLYEIARAHNEAEVKSVAQKARIASIEDGIVRTREQHQGLREDLGSLNA